MTRDHRIRCLLVDDELPALDELAYLLSKFEDITILDTAMSATQAVEKIHGLRPDVVFQDIHMPGGTGFQVLEHAMRSPSPPLFVLATAYDQYAIRAFEERALDYLLKPISEERLLKCVDRLREQLRAPSAPVTHELEAVLRSMGRPSAVRVSVEWKGKILLLPHTDVVFARAENRRIVVYTREQYYLLHGQAPLDKLEARLEPLSFFRANRSELLNLEHIRDFAPWFNGKYLVTMHDLATTEITISKNRARAFRERVCLT